MNEATSATQSTATETKVERYRRARIASTETEVKQALRLRYDVFVAEMGEGTVNDLKLDYDPFDLVCKHLIVENAEGDIIGTYRMQTGLNALENLGYYSQNEFDMAAFDTIRGQTLELGRACVSERHRNTTALSKLWSGIAEYAHETKSRYLIGCSSLHSTDPVEAATAFMWLKDNGHLVDPRFTVMPHESGTCDTTLAKLVKPKLPRLFRAYLEIVGAKICGPPFIDRSFKTTDFLTFVDLEKVPAGVRERYLEA